MYLINKIAISATNSFILLIPGSLWHCNITNVCTYTIVKYIPTVPACQFMLTCVGARGESIMLFELPITLSGNSFLINLLFSKLFLQKAALLNKIHANM